MCAGRAPARLPAQRAFRLLTPVVETRFLVTTRLRVLGPRRRKASDEEEEEEETRGGGEEEEAEEEDEEEEVEAVHCVDF